MPQKKNMNPDLLPVFEITFEEDDTKQGVRFVSLVEDPAIDTKGMYFSKEEKQFEFKKVDDQMKIVGPAMIPNKKIFRRDGDYEYFVIFKPETIKKMAQKFNKENNNKSINVDHSSEMVNAYIEQNWIIEDAQFDKSKMYGYQCPVGTWFIEVKVDDEDFWETQVKELGKYSFSVEGLMGMSPYQMRREFSLDDLTDIELESMLRDIMKDRVSFDFDGVLSTNQGQDLARLELKRGNTVFIVTKRSPFKQSKEVFQVADMLGIPRENIHFTNGTWKWKKLNDLQVDKHYDDQDEEITRIQKHTNITTKKVG